MFVLCFRQNQLTHLTVFVYLSSQHHRNRDYSDRLVGVKFDCLPQCRHMQNRFIDSCDWYGGSVQGKRRLWLLMLLSLRYKLCYCRQLLDFSWFYLLTSQPSPSYPEDRHPYIIYSKSSFWARSVMFHCFGEHFFFFSCIIINNCPNQP